MVYRKFNAPNVEYNEIDRSQYGLINDGAAVGTMTFFTGFADEGDDYSAKYSRSLQDFVLTYGYPTNEAERYFYNAAQEVFSHGGRVITSKIPYDNDSKDKLAFTVFQAKKNSLSTYLNLFSESEDLSDTFASIDPSITSYFELESLDKDQLTNYLSSIFIDVDYSGLMRIDQYDDILVGKERIPENTICIVDIVRNKYSKDVSMKNLQINETDRFLGYVPVIVSPMNALYYQRILSSESFPNPASNFQTIYNAGNIISTSIYDSQASAVVRMNVVDEMSALQDFYLPISADDIDSESVSKSAGSMFPAINFLEENVLDRTYMKQIGLVVFKMAYNPSSKKIDFNPVEAFIGSLDKREVDPITGRKLFIDEIVNSQSEIVNFFSNFNFEKYEKTIETEEGKKQTVLMNSEFKQASTIFIKNQTVTSLGFFDSQCAKYISTKTINDSLDLILENCKDPYTVLMDIVCDAGVSNIAQYMATNLSTLFYEPEYDSPEDYVLNQDTVSAWRNVLKKFDDFVKYQRKDCIFLADGPRTLCLAGNQKIIRKSAPKNTITKNLIPKIRYMTGLNSSYSAGYCDWFQCVDTTSQSYFWCPPSIKATGVYLYTDRYANTWDAPAGDNRGRIADAYDVAFDPTVEEAEKFYEHQWNYAISQPLVGITLEGQKTFQVNKTALDRVNVRRLCLAIKKGIRELARWFKYEAINDYIMDRFREQLNEFLQRIQSKDGVSEYYLKLDHENNTDETIDRNELHVTIAIRPIKTAEFIIINSIIVNQSADLEEVTQSVLS